MDTKITKRIKYLALIMGAVMIFSTGAYAVFVLDQSYRQHKENLRAVFYEEGQPKTAYWSVTIHPIGSSSNAKTLTSNSTEIVFSGLEPRTYGYSFSPMKGDIVLSYAGPTTSFGLFGTRNGTIDVGLTILPVQPGKPITVKTVCTLGVYYPKIVSNDVWVYFDNNGTVYNLSASGNSVVYAMNSPFNYIVKTSFVGVLNASKYCIYWLGSNATANYNNVPTNPDPPFVDVLSADLIFTANMTLFSQESHYRIFMSGY